MEQSWSLRASDDDVTLQLPDDFVADFEAETSDGRIETRHPIAVVGKVSGRHITGKMNGGGHLLRIQTADGNIIVE